MAEPALSSLPPWSNSAGGHSRPVAGVDHGQVDVADRFTERTSGHPRHRVDGRAALALTVSLDEKTAEPGSEAGTIAHGGLGAERARKGVVGVVGSLGGGEDVRDGLSDVAELRRLEPADVTEEGRSR